MSEHDDKAAARARAGRRAGLTMAAVGIFWVLATALGGAYGLSNRERALLDLLALAGFVYALWLTWGAWRSGQ